MARNLEWFIARRYLASRRKGRFLSLITLIAIGGVFLGVTALITVIAVMTGLQRDLQRMILGSTPHVYLFQAGRGGFRLDAWREVLPRVEAVEGVTSASPFVLTQVGVMRPTLTYAQPGTLYGVDPTVSDRPLTLVEQQIRAGELALGPTASGLPGVLLGRGLADHLTVLPGDTIIVAAFENLKQDLTGEPRPKIAQFEVTGVFRTGMYEYDNQNLYVDLAAAQELLDFHPQTVSGIAINTPDAWTARDVAERVFRSLGPEYYVDNWMNLNSSLFSALKLEKLAMAVILFLIVLVAAFNIVSTLIMVVADKTREIGILKSMGLTSAAVQRIFILQGLAIGLVGTALGALGGLGLVWVIDRYDLISLPGDVYFLDTLPVALEPLDFALIVLASVAVAFVATIYPSRQASRLLPVDAIRHE